MRTLQPDEVAYLGAPPVRIDLLRSADGVDTDAVIDRATAAEVDGISIPIIAVEDLIANKRAAGRPQDTCSARLAPQPARSRDKTKTAVPLFAEPPFLWS